MADKILHKRSLTTGSIPTISSLSVGEIALNIPDGKIYIHKSGSQGESIESSITSNSTSNIGTLVLSGSLILSGSTGVNSGSVFDVSTQNISFDFDFLSFSGSAEITGSLSVNDGTYLKLDTATHTLYDQIGTQSLDWANRFLFDVNGIQSTDWASRALYDVNVLQSLNWLQRSLTDTSELVSIDWGNRQLLDSTGALILDWSSSLGLLTGSLYGTASWAESASYASTASSLLNNTIGEFNINFGSPPGTNTVTTTISNLLVKNSSYINIYIMSTSSVDHNSEDHKLFSLYSRTIPGNIIDNTSFDVTCITDLRINGIFKAKYIINNF